MIGTVSHKAEVKIKTIPAAICDEAWLASSLPVEIFLCASLQNLGGKLLLQNLPVLRQRTLKSHKKTFISPFQPWKAAVTCMMCNMGIYFYSKGMFLGRKWNKPTAQTAASGYKFRLLFKRLVALACNHLFTMFSHRWRKAKPNRFLRSNCFLHCSVSTCF